MPSTVGRIRRKATFRALSRPDGRATSGPVTVLFSRRSVEAAPPGLAGRSLVGYAVGRAHGGAVARNRLRRRLRAAVRQAAPSLPVGAFLVRADPGASTLDFGGLAASVREAAAGATGGRSPAGGGPAR
jgi:ribonuclease P protein component